MTNLAEALAKIATLQAALDRAQERNRELITQLATVNGRVADSIARAETAERRLADIR